MPQPLRRTTKTVSRPESDIPRTAWASSREARSRHRTARRDATSRDSRLIADSQIVIASSKSKHRATWARASSMDATRALGPVSTRGSDQCSAASPAWRCAFAPTCRWTPAGAFSGIHHSLRRASDMHVSLADAAAAARRSCGAAAVVIHFARMRSTSPPRIAALIRDGGYPCSRASSRCTMPPRLFTQVFRSMPTGSCPEARSDDGLSGVCAQAHEACSCAEPVGVGVIELATTGISEGCGFCGQRRGIRPQNLAEAAEPGLRLAPHELRGRQHREAG